jgi:UDP-N-acetylmuramate dehydrogenase
MKNGKHDGSVGDDFLIKENVPLQGFNTLAIPVTARYCCRAESLTELKAGLRFAQERQLTVLVLGEGSNTVFTQDFNGLVVLNRLHGIEILSEDAVSININAAAGESWHQFVDYCLDQEWFGHENLALIPGLVGAAPIQNIGAYGVEVKDTIQSVTYIELATGKTHRIGNSECQFEYRDSIFKNRLNAKTIIVSVEFRLSKSPTKHLAYPALANKFDSEPSPRDIFNRVCELRCSKLPMPKDIPNAGSFFKNPVISTDQFTALQQAYPDIVGFDVAGGVKLAAAWLIEQQGWKDREIAGVKVHQKQSLVITNPKYKTGNDILRLAEAIQKDIMNSFDVFLEIEPRIY